MALFQADQSARLLSVDEMWSRRIGIELGEKWTRLIRPEQRAEIESLWEQACASRLPFSVVARCAPAIGATTIRVSAEPASPSVGSQTVYLGAILIDEADHLDHASVLESVADGILVVRADGQIVIANDRTHAIFGYAEGELIGLSVDRLVPEAFREGHRRQRSEFGASPRVRPMGGPVLPAVRKDGTIVPVEIRLAPLQSSGQEDEWHVSAVIRDVSERTASEKEALLRERMAGIGSLASMLMHEVNNPLTAVVANLHLALEDLATSGAQLPAVTVAVRDACLAAEQIGSIVRELGGLAASQHGTRALVDPRDVIERAIRLSGPAVSVSIPIERSYEGSGLVWVSPVLLGQVFVNLLVNAAEAMEALPTQARGIGARVIERGEHVHCEISDRGPGVPATVLGQIFDPYFSTKKRERVGGIGLALSRHIVAELGGELAVVDRRGWGATFRVTLPRASS